MITLSDLCFGYNGQSALTGIDLHVPSGNCVALLGANASGKSTLLMLLTGLYRPGQGTIQVGKHHSPGQEGKLRREVGLLMQDADLQILGATVQEDLELSARVGGMPLTSTWDLACRFCLKESWQTPVHHLSGGQKRKLCLAGMMLRQPQVLLYDEPFSGLDYPAILELRSLLKANAAAGITQVVAAHDVEPLIGIADTCLVLQQGRLMYSGPLQAVMDDLPAYSVRPPCSWQAGRGLEPWR